LLGQPPAALRDGACLSLVHAEDPPPVALPPGDRSHGAAGGRPVDPLQPHPPLGLLPVRPAAGRRRRVRRPSPPVLSDRPADGARGQGALHARVGVRTPRGGGPRCPAGALRGRGLPPPRAGPAPRLPGGGLPVPLRLLPLLLVRRPPPLPALPRPHRCDPAGRGDATATLRWSCRGRHRSEIGR